MSRGIIYYNKGTKCRVRLLTSLYSLRRHYAGPVAVLHEQDDGAEEWFRTEAARFDAALVALPESPDSALTRKAQLWRWTPFDTTLFLDADTIVLTDPSPLFEAIERGTFMTYHFSGWRTDGGKIAKRIRAWEPAAGPQWVADAIALGPAVNTGIHGYTRDAEILPEWERLTRAGWAKNCTRRLVDELACQVLLPQFRHEIVGPEWGASVRFGDISQAKIIHYHGSKHCLEYPACEIWKQIYWDYRNTSPAYNQLGVAHGDKRFARYLQQAQRSDVTIVSAVNPAYLDRFAANWAAWMQTPGIREQRFIVFTNRLGKTFLNAWRNVTVIPWKFPVAGDNIRERMLSAFVFGTAKHVGTHYWMKLDADATPTGRPWEWPDYRDYTITGHRCGYTKTKGQPGATRHFLNQLDDWYCTIASSDINVPIQTFHGDVFPEFPVNDKAGGRRVASYCWIENTAFTRQLAMICGERLPVPSHDTTAWYVAMRQNMPIQRRNMRRWFRP